MSSDPGFVRAEPLTNPEQYVARVAQFREMRLGQTAALTGEQARAALVDLIGELLGADARHRQAYGRAQALQADLDVLAPVGRLYLDAFADGEMMTMGESYRLNEVEEVVTRWEAAHG